MSGRLQPFIDNHLLTGFVTLVTIATMLTPPTQLTTSLPSRRIAKILFARVSSR